MTRCGRRLDQDPTHFFFYMCISRQLLLLRTTSRCTNSPHHFGGQTIAQRPTSRDPTLGVFHQYVGTLRRRIPTPSLCDITRISFRILRCPEFTLQVRSSDCIRVSSSRCVSYALRENAYVEFPFSGTRLSGSPHRRRRPLSLM